MHAATYLLKERKSGGLAATLSERRDESWSHDISRRLPESVDQFA
jgi:hypothetical protein